MAQFLPRDAMRKHGTNAVGRCLSVRLPHSCIASRRIKKLNFLGPVAYHSSFFKPSNVTQFEGKPPHRRRQVHGVGKNCDFRLKSQFVSETVQDRSMVYVTQQRLHIPRRRTTEFQKSFTPRTTPEWNSLPNAVTSAASVSSFSSQLTTSVMSLHP